MSLYGFFFILMLLGIVVWAYALFDMSKEKVKPKKATMKKVHSDLLQMQHQLEEVNEKLDALIVTLNFRPKIECPPELQGRLKQLQIAINRHFCAAGERGVDDCAWNCRYAGTEKCNSKCRYSSIGDSGVPGSEAAGAADSTGEEAQP